MPTPPTPDEEFDAHFRQSLENYPELSADPAAWHSLDAQLDAEMEHRLLRQRVLGGFGGEVLAVLLALGLGLWWAAPAPPRGPVSVASSERPTTTPADRPRATTAPAATKNLAATTVKIEPTSAPGTPLTAESSGRPAALGNRSPPNKTIVLPQVNEPTAGAYRKKSGPLWAAALIKTSPGARPSTPWLNHESPLGLIAKTPGWELPANGTATSRRPLDETATGRTQTGGGKASTAAAPGVEVAASSAARPKPVDPLTMAKGSGRAVPALVPLPAPLAPVALAFVHPTDPLPAPKTRLAGAYRLQLGLVGALELSSVRTGPLTGPGGDLGLHLEYRLAPRWHLGTGYLQAIKRYVASGSDYHPPAKYWTNYLVVNEVWAKCRVVDIPLNLRYDLWQGPTAQVFVSTGLSSLLMRRERYTYDYDVAGQPKAVTWELRNGSTHVLQILNLSAGYERTLGGRWTAQAEPFVKLPLGGVGFGAVRLSSAGMFFSLKYGLLPMPAPPVAQ